MQIAKNSVVSLSYEMYDGEGNLIDKTDDHPMVYLHGGYGDIFPLVEETLHGKSVGEVVDIELSVEDAYGEHYDDLVRVEPKNAFPAEVKVGMMFETDDPETGEIQLFTVTSIDGDVVTIDGNHPLAGMPIRFRCTVQNVREATRDELEHGHVHGEHGHHH